MNAGDKAAVAGKVQCLVRLNRQSEAQDFLNSTSALTEDERKQWQENLFAPPAKGQYKFNYNLMNDSNVIQLGSNYSSKKESLRHLIGGGIQKEFLTLMDWSISGLGYFNLASSVEKSLQSQDPMILIGGLSFQKDNRWKLQALFEKYYLDEEDSGTRKNTLNRFSFEAAFLWQGSKISNNILSLALFNSQNKSSLATGDYDYGGGTTRISWQNRIQYPFMQRLSTEFAYERNNAKGKQMGYAEYFGFSQLDFFITDEVYLGVLGQVKMRDFPQNTDERHDILLACGGAGGWQFSKSFLVTAHIQSERNQSYSDLYSYTRTVMGLGLTYEGFF